MIVLSAAFKGKNANDDITTVSSLYVLVFYLTNMHVMSHRSDFLLTCSSKVNSYEPAFYVGITYPLTVTQIELRRVQFPTMMSDSKSQTMSFSEVMISAKNDHVFICDLSNLTF